MTSPQRSLHPASGNDRRSFLGALEPVACGRMQFAQVVGAVVGHRVALEPGPQIFDWIEVGRVRWQERNLDVPAQRVQIVAHEVAVVCPGPVSQREKILRRSTRFVGIARKRCQTDSPESPARPLAPDE